MSDSPTAGPAGRTLESIMAEALEERGIKAPQSPAMDDEAAKDAPVAPDAAQSPQDTPPDLVKAMAEALAPPDRPDGYRIDRPFVASGAGYDEELEQTARQWFLKAGLNQGQVSGIVDKYNRASLDPIPVDHAMDEHRRLQAEGELRSEFGDEFDKKIAAAGAAVRRLGGEELVELLEETQLGNDPEIIRHFVALAGNPSS